MAEEYVETNEYSEDDFEGAEVVETKPKDANLMKVQNQAKQLEIEEKRLNFEMEEAKAKRELDSKKLDLELKKLDYDKELKEKEIAVEEKKAKTDAERAENEKKDAKKERISGYVKAGLGLGGVIMSSLFSAWALMTTLKFEESGSVRTSGGKYAQALCKNSGQKLENVKKEL